MIRFLPVPAALLFSALSIGAPATEIVIGDPYVRAVPPGQPNSAAFMSLNNPSTSPRALVDATSPFAEIVELHTHLNEGGMMRMRPVERIALPAGETVLLQPGGLHVMLIGLKRPLTPDTAVELTLMFDDGSKVSIQAPVRQIDPSQIHGQH